MLRIKSSKSKTILAIGLMLTLSLIIIPQTKPVRAETVGGSCVVANQATKDQLSTQSPYNQMTITVLDPAETINNTTYDAQVVCIPDLNLKQAMQGGATAETNVMTEVLKANSGSFYAYDLITSLTGIEYMTKIINLTLPNNQISDISPLANLRNLTQLGLPNNQISDISPLANLRNLTQLALYNNQISDISSLTNLTQLKGLNI